MSQENLTLRQDQDSSGKDNRIEEHDKNALELIYQNLSDLVKKNLLGQDAILDHISSRPPGECQAVGE